MKKSIEKIILGYRYFCEMGEDKIYIHTDIGVGQITQEIIVAWLEIR